MRKKVLIVEDNSELLAFLRQRLRAAGFSVATATNGIEALKKARSVGPDIILLDLVLPELDGFAVCETLRRAPATADIPIVILSGLTSEYTRTASLQCGADEYLVKPIEAEELMAKVKELVAHNAPTRHLKRSGRENTRLAEVSAN